MASFRPKTAVFDREAASVLDSPSKNRQAKSYLPQANRRCPTYISAFDDKFKVDLNLENSPPLSAVTQGSLDFSYQANQWRDRVLGVSLFLVTLFFILVSLGIEFSLLSPSNNLLWQYFDEFPLLFVMIILYSLFSWWGLKIFKHNQ